MITLIKISNREIIDIVKYSDDKAIIVEKLPLGDIGQYKVNYFVLNFNNGDKEVITKNAYLLKKFGNAFHSISEKVINYVQCDAIVFPNKNTLVTYPNGQAGYFTPDGELKWSGELKYNDSFCCSAAADDDYFWNCCPNENCVIRYSADKLKVDIRIGSKDSNTFISPFFASADDNYVYVCCDNDKVRKIDKKNLAVSDVKGKYSGLKKFYKYGRFSIICTSDGAFIDKD